MRARTYIISLLVLLLSAPLWGQVEPSAEGGSGAQDDDSMMPLTPMVSGSFFSTGGTGGRSNFLAGGVVFTAAYDDNLLAGPTGSPVGAETYSIWPTISYEQSTSRTHAGISYSPGFTFFEPITSDNSFSQNLNADFQYRLSPRLTMTFQDVFEQNSSALAQPYTLAGATITGNGQSSTPYVILPYTGQVLDSTTGGLDYQFSKNGMIGGNGYYSVFHYPNLSQNPGLYNSDSKGGSGFYSRRLTRTQFIGATYRYSDVETNPIDTSTNSQTASLFYTLLIANQFTLSLSGGPEYSTTTLPVLSTPGLSTSTHAWSPSGAASLGWQRSHVSVAASYARSVTSGEGLLGAYRADSASLSAHWKVRPRWTLSVTSSYANINDSTPTVLVTSPNGHTIFGSTSAQYLINEHLTAVAEYDRLHQTYGIQTISINPDVDRVSVSLNYQFMRPLGR